MTPTDEQLAIVARARETEDNILINAFAGAAKTTSLVLLAEALPEVSILSLCFNKKNAVEAQEKLPRNCKAMTLNAIGHRTWMEATGRRLQIDASKNYNIMKELVDQVQDKGEKDLLFEKFGDILRTVAFGKNCGYVPSGHYEGRAKRLMDDSEFFEHLDEKLSAVEEDMIRAVTLESLRLSFQGQCDYDDQVLMPTVFMGAFPRYPLVLVDEAQDLSSLNHAMLRKMVKKRIIAVGDANQAIYGFRGAHQDSMQLLQQEFDMKEMTLSTSFRCPIQVIKHARWKVPTMTWPEWAKEGKVEHLKVWSADTLPEQATIICRNNAPLFDIGVKLLAAGRSIELHGRDLVQGILKHMRKFGGHDLPQADVLERIDLWEVDQQEKHKQRAHGSIADRAECMRIFARQGRDLGEALAYAQHIVQLHSPLKLMTGHGSKGLEFDHVFFLDEHLLGKDGKKNQDPNLRYVVQTRARDTLTYIRSEDYR